MIKCDINKETCNVQVNGSVKEVLYDFYNLIVCLKKSGITDNQLIASVMIALKLNIEEEE